MVAGQEWNDGEMRDGIRKILNKRESRRQGKNVYSWKVPYRDANGKQSSETFGTLKEAKAFRDKTRTRRNEGLIIDAKAGAVSVAGYAAEWLKTAAVKRPTTYKNYEGYVRLHIVPALGGHQLRAVTRADVQGFVNGLVCKGLAPGTIRNVYMALASMFRAAHELDRRIPASPCVRITLPEAPAKEVHVLTVPQVRALAAAMPQRYRAAVLLAAGTGLRISEVCGLTWDRVDLEAGVLKVDRQMAETCKLAPPKTRHSKRVVPVPQMVVAALREHRESFPPVAQDIPHVDGSIVRDAEFIFTRPKGRPITAYGLREAFCLARARAGVPETVVFHALRHTYASIQIAAGTSLPALRDRMGHASIMITADTYGHLYPEEDDRTRSAIDDAFVADTDSGSGTANLSVAS
ncbi:tyrosine-type recombinase/integrase [Thermomonospora amylolytica]|uniref:tyrosine-type recombinase/integrase n=1 Tax=Thermomonospora amylolytica TaxID=1411117 RepID=UPI0018E5A947|nr:tyrosine-type recombinase/integrase [Thermomonospora amylolytica]